MKMYKKGREIISLTGLGSFLDKGQWIYYRHKAYHPGWIISMQFKTLNEAMKKGWLFTAIKTQKEIKK